MERNWRIQVEHFLLFLQSKFVPFFWPVFLNLYPFAGTSLSAGSHWEKRVFEGPCLLFHFAESLKLAGVSAGEYMVSDAASPEPVVSPITFAAMEDTGRTGAKRMPHDALVLSISKILDEPHF